MRTIPEKETLTIEFKSDRNCFPDKPLVEEVVGMTNAEGGEIYLGVEDHGEITGVHKKHKDSIGLQAMVANKTVPPVAVTAALIEDEGKQIQKIEVPKNLNNITATSDGKIVKRRINANGEPENRPLYPYEIPSRLSELGRLDFSASILTNADLDDLDLSLLSALRSMITMQGGDGSLLELTDEELLQSLHLIQMSNHQIHPTVAGLLLIGKPQKIRELLPTAESSFQVLNGTDVLINKQSFDPLLVTLPRFMDYFAARNPETEVEEGLFRVPIPEFSRRAFREGIMNAFSHRDYTILRPVRVCIEDDGLIISNPGGFVEGVTIDNLLTVDPHGRNPLLTDILKRIGLAERTGRGVDRIFEGSISYGRPLPDYSESTSSNIKLFIPRAKADVDFIKMISDLQMQRGGTISIQQLLILSYLQSMRRLTLEEFSQLLHLPVSRIRPNLEILVELGVIEAHGTRNQRDYLLSQDVYKMQNNSFGYLQQTSTDESALEKKIMEKAASPAGVTTRDMISSLNMSKGQAYRMLKHLVDSGKLTKEGAGRSTRYVIRKE
ncbi:putative DNA binding domain-containing protein [Erysipelotrichaceae bacterium RD49]|nr:putative DNA binding domain-containing protein [Erysipelotrichaceae bacterium RD49]